MNNRRRALRHLGAAPLALSTWFWPRAALAQSFAFSKPVRWIVPYAAGGLPDTVARVYAKHLAENEGDLRSELLPVDKALALKELREMIEGDAGKRMSASGFVRELEQLGLSAISRRQLGRLEFLVGLSEVLPVTLRIDPGTSGLGNNQIDQLINLKKGLLKFWCDKNKLDQTFEILWDQELSVYDAYGYFEIEDRKSVV